jgi:hypothetical protein
VILVARKLWLPIGHDASRHGALFLADVPAGTRGPVGGTLERGTMLRCVFAALVRARIVTATTLGPCGSAEHALLNSSQPEELASLPAINPSC